jgi:plasmid stabilization system protein ParE
VAENYLSALDALYDRLASFPASGPRRPGLGAHIRIGVLEPYVVFYRYVPGSDRVGVVRVLHGRRDVTAKLLRGG